MATRAFIVVASRESPIAAVSIAALIFLVAWARSGLGSAARSRVLGRGGDGGDGRDRRARLVGKVA